MVAVVVATVVVVAAPLVVVVVFGAVVVVVVVVGVAAHVGRLIVSWIKVTAPAPDACSPARRRPVTVTLSPKGDVVVGEDRSLEPCARMERRRAADLPEDVARLGAVDEVDRARRGGGERGAGLEDEDGVLVAAGR